MCSVVFIHVFIRVSYCCYLFWVWAWKSLTVLFYLVKCILWCARVRYDKNVYFIMKGKQMALPNCTFLIACTLDVSFVSKGKQMFPILCSFLFFRSLKCSWVWWDHNVYSFISKVLLLPWILFNYSSFIVFLYTFWRANIHCYQIERVND